MQISLMKFDEFMSNKIKPAYRQGKIKDEEDLHYRLSKFVRQWIGKALKENKAPSHIDSAVYEIQEVGYRLKLMHGIGDAVDFDQRELVAYWDFIRELTAAELENVNRIIKGFIEHYPDLGEKFGEINL